MKLTKLSCLWETSLLSIRLIWNPQHRFLQFRIQTCLFLTYLSRFKVAKVGAGARHKSQDKTRDAALVKNREAGLNLFKRGNVTGSMRENNGHFREQLKVENNRQDESLRWPLNLNNPWYCRLGKQLHCTSQEEIVS